MSGYFVGKEKEEWYFVPTVTAPASPSAAEINAGERITDDIREVSGFTSKANTFSVPTMKGGRAAQLTGTQETEASSLVFAEQDTYAGNTIKAALAEATDGYIVISRYKKGAVAAADAGLEVWPVRVGGNNRQHTVDDQEARFLVDFAVTADPEIDVTAAA